MSESTSLKIGLPRPPAHGKYVAANKPRPQEGNCMKYFCIAFVLALLLTLAINAIVLLVAFKKAEAPEFEVSAVQVSKFSAVSPLKNDRVVLSTDLTFEFEASNKNPIVGYDLENVAMQATWDELNAHLGEAQVENIVQKMKGKRIVRVSTKGAVEITKKDIEVGDMKLDLSLIGELKYLAGPFKTEKHPFMVSCNNITPTSSNAPCDTKIYSNGEAPPKPGMAKAVAPPPQEFGQSQAPTPPPPESFPPVKLTVQEKSVILDNGLVAITIAKPAGFVTGIKYNGMDNILDIKNPEDDRGYFSYPSKI